MATVTPGKVFSSNEIVTPTNLNALGVPTVTLADNEVTTAKIADGAVTQSKLNSSVTLVPTGAIMPFAMNSAPSGWLAADGTAVSRTTYAALFAAIGTTYGAGTGGTTFNLPDLRGIFVRGINSQTISGVTYSGTLATKQGDSVGPHTHSGTTDNMSANATHDHNMTVTGLGLGGSGGNPVQSTSSFGANSTSIQTANTEHQHTFTTSSQSPASTTETRPANIALLYCIKA